MRIVYSAEFATWFGRLVADADDGDQLATVKLGLVASELAVLRALDGAPTLENERADLKQVRQSGRYTVWRVSHPYQPGVAVRLICWFPPDAKSWSSRCSPETRPGSATSGTTSSAPAPTRSSSIGRGRSAMTATPEPRPLGGGFVDATDSVDAPLARPDIASSRPSGRHGRP